MKNIHTAFPFIQKYFLLNWLVERIMVTSSSGYVHIFKGWYHVWSNRTLSFRKSPESCYQIYPSSYVTLCNEWLSFPQAYIMWERHWVSRRDRIHYNGPIVIRTVIMYRVFFKTKLQVMEFGSAWRQPKVIWYLPNYIFQGLTLSKVVTLRIACSI